MIILIRINWPLSWPECLLFWWRDPLTSSVCFAGSWCCSSTSLPHRPACPLLSHRPRLYARTALPVNQDDLLASFCCFATIIQSFKDLPSFCMLQQISCTVGFVFPSPRKLLVWAQPQYTSPGLAGQISDGTDFSWLAWESGNEIFDLAKVPFLQKYLQLWQFVNVHLFGLVLSILIQPVFSVLQLQWKCISVLEE